MSKAGKSCGSEVDMRRGCGNGVIVVNLGWV